ncbi:AMP-binding protein [Actinosynnema sp. NPDC047251]|uniref:AMP-dependent acetyl-coenzyme A synthetase and ligase n=1 Tax=Saccharothrix espanaensis (strain ATCC 51144 / DSM 44229 / JCM 9112 / NBRC 15066 / NRRL 15764) TaxID=1179773 RepID=K0JU46_SACES|nr:AMP-binding protein [Saccharothrix espanaensis]CCH31345.1 AMP-dependent acetyl-coenzyme A synthetase and ligase [Saccharothrix espanaensis DSM 44229]
MHRSAHVDTFCRDHLPPPAQQPDFVFDLPELHYPDRLNCAVALLDGAIARFGADRPCLRTTDETWTYGELDARSSRIAHVLVDEFGLRPGNRVMLRGPNNPWTVAAWLAVVKAGGVAVTVMPLLRAKEIAELVALTATGLVLSDHRFATDLPDGVPSLLYGGDGPDDLVARCTAKPDSFASVDTAADDVALLAPTSGTTGRPKATMHYHRDVLACADTFARHVLKPEPDDVFTGTPPIGFTFGLGGLVVFPMRFGASTFLVERATPEELADTVAAHGVTVLFTAPTAYKAMLAAGKARELAGLRRCVSAGEHLPPSTWEHFRRETGLRIINGIGGTELLHIFISAADDDIRPGATGKAVPGFRAAVLDEDGNPAPDGVPGRLAVKGPTGCRYLADPRQLDYVRDGWNLTGDTYVRDADGYFWFQARNDDMIISSGYNIAGPEVEAALLDHPDVAETAVVGAPDPDRGAIAHAFVVLRAGAPADPAKAAELQAFVKSVIAPYKYPRRVEFVAELPKTPSGKVQRFKLRAQVRERSPGAITAGDALIP